jgi:hypothetical protein
MTRTIASLVPLLSALAVSASACGGSAQSPAASPASSEGSSESSAGTHKAHQADEGSRLLTEPECQKLGQWVSEACQSRPNDRSAKVDGWCSDVMHGMSDGSWVDGCEKRVTKIDSMCLESSSNVHIMMDCSHSVSR